MNYFLLLILFLCQGCYSTFKVKFPKDLTAEINNQFVRDNFDFSVCSSELVGNFISECSPETTLENVSYSIHPANTCHFFKINPYSGYLTGAPDNSISSCNLMLSLSSGNKTGIYSTSFSVKKGIKIGGDKGRVIATKDRYTYVGQSNEIYVYDILDPSNPVLVHINNSVSYPRSIKIKDDFLYVADSSSLRIFSIQNPASLKFISAERIIDAVVTDIEFYGQYVLASASGKGLLVYDVFDKTKVKLVSSVTTTNALGLTVAGNYTFVADGANGLVVIDISNIQSPSIIGGVDTLGSAVKVKVQGNYAYIADGTSGIQVIDVSVVTNPIHLSNYDTNGTANDIQIIGNILYLADGMPGIKIFNISNPASLVLTSSRDNASHALNLSYQEGYVYVAENEGFLIWDVSVASAPVLVHKRFDSFHPREAKVQGNVLAVGGYNSIKLFDVENINQVLELSTISLGSNALFIDGDFIYNGNGTVFSIIDFSNPMSTSVVGTLALGNILGIKVKGDFAYIADGVSGLRIVDISDKNTPVLVSTLDTDGTATELDIVGDILFLADGVMGVKLIDISNPNSPQLLSVYPTPNLAQDITVSGNYGYVSIESWGLQIFDISNVMTPSFVGGANFGTAISVIIENNLALISRYWQGVGTVDISDPTNPILLNGFNYGDPTYTIEVDSRYIYATGWRRGLYIVER